MIGPDAAVPQHPLLEQTAPALARAAHDAARLDIDGVTAADVTGLAASGLLGAGSPSELGGGGAPDAVVRELAERLAAASGSLWFVAAQHRSPADAAQRTTNPALHDRWAASLASGRALGAVAFAHLRRPGPPPVVAVPDGDGWRVSGRLDWLTSWGLADVLLLLAETPDGEVLQLLLPAVERPGLTVVGPLGLAAMAGTSTVVVDLQGMTVSADEVASCVAKEDWAARDGQRTANASPASFGLARAAVEGLAGAGRRRHSAAAEDLASALGQKLVEVRREAYALIDDAAPDEELDRRLQLRAAALDLAVRATTALVATEGGRAMALDSAAQRWAREALFQLVQAQTAPLREELLGRWRRQIRPA